MARAAHRVPALIIGEQDQEVWFGWLAFGSEDRSAKTRSQRDQGCQNSLFHGHDDCEVLFLGLFSGLHGMILGVHIPH
jgi:hypothetical protein